ncbi:unnamed protein product [Durusdinium trenchii]
MVLVWLLLATRSLAQLQYSYTDHATALRKHLTIGYDPMVPPRSQRRVNYSAAGTDVGMSIRFFKVQGVSASTGQMRLKVWVRLRWTDDRLRWNPEDYGNISETNFYGGDITDRENTEIWVPDIQPYNSNVGIQVSLDRTAPTVYSTGVVFWSRPGLIDILCKFSGLVAFPFDNLKCAMEWGGWSFSSVTQGIYLEGDGYVFLSSEDTAGASYQEYSIKKVEVDLKTTFYEAAGTDAWTVVKYTVELNRAAFYYGTLILFPTILVTVLSFGVFFMSHEVGERLSFGITLLLVVEVMRSTVSTFVPICGELLWIDLFMLVNSVFCCLSLLETMTVLFFAFHTDEHLLPTWLAWLAPWIFWRGGRRTGPVESQAGSIFRRFSKGILKEPKTPMSKIEENLKEGKLTESDTAKLIFFENLFYMLDSDSNGLITVEDACCMLSFVNLSMSRQALKGFLEENWPEHKRFNCSDFVEICVELMWVMPFHEIKMGAENYMSSYNRFTKLCANYWLSWSKTVDRWSRFWLPMFYFCALGILFNLELTDDYLGGAGSNEMFQGFGNGYMSVAGVFRALVMPIFAGISVAAWFYMRRQAKQKRAALGMRESQVTPMPPQEEEEEPEEMMKPIVPRWSIKPGTAGMPGMLPMMPPATD